MTNPTLSHAVFARLRREQPGLASATDETLWLVVDALSHRDLLDLISESLRDLTQPTCRSCQTTTTPNNAVHPYRAGPLCQSCADAYSPYPPGQDDQ